MMMKQKFAILCLFLISFYGCNGEQQKKQKISFDFMGGSGKKVVLYELGTSKATPVDSINLDANGKGLINIQVDEPHFYRLSASQDNFLVMILSNQDKQVFIKGKYDAMASTYTISGSAESELLRSTSAMLQKNYMKADSMQKAYSEYKNKGDEAAASSVEGEYMKMAKEENTALKTLIDQSPASFVALAMLERLDKDKDMAYIEKVASAFLKKYPQSDYTKSLQSMVANSKLLSKGSIPPDIKLSSPEGKEIALSSLKGKVVLLDFWASWCRPCRMENPNVVNIYNKFNEKGFTVYSVSLDKSKDAWAEAIQKDGLAWPNHVSDLGFWSSSVVKLYKIEGIPMTFVLDREGKIVAKNLRGKELEDCIAGLINP
jgi:thiol-disulfide isomerase/thioredoxin